MCFLLRVVALSLDLPAGLRPATIAGDFDTVYLAMPAMDS
jgi:hypothetical protein